MFICIEFSFIFYFVLLYISQLIYLHTSHYFIFLFFVVYFIQLFIYLLFYVFFSLCSFFDFFFFFIHMVTQCECYVYRFRHSNHALSKRVGESVGAQGWVGSISDTKLLITRLIRICRWRWWYDLPHDFLTFMSLCWYATSCIYRQCVHINVRCDIKMCCMYVVQLVQLAR